MIELAQQRRLPPVPYVGADGADVGDGQDQQQLEPFRRLHPLNKVVDRFRVPNVELERGAAHQKMPPHQPRDGFGLFVRKSKPWGELASDLLADFRVVTTPALGNVVQQDG